ncbi:hypothetical protein BH10PSE3_BH10PSE3_17450 [soil metagenome]
MKHLGNTRCMARFELDVFSALNKIGPGFDSFGAQFSGQKSVNDRRDILPSKDCDRC